MSNDREEFEKCRRKLYALADRMGMQITIIVRRKSKALEPDPPNVRGPGPREPGDD